MSTRHTPGPWTLSEEFSSSPSGQSYRSNAITAGGKLVGRAQGFSEANARLIAAAPDLLALVRDWLAYWEQLDSESESALAEDSRAAIDKATR